MNPRKVKFNKRNPTHGEPLYYDELTSKGTLIEFKTVGTLNELRAIIIECETGKCYAIPINHIEFY